MYVFDDTLGFVQFPEVNAECFKLPPEDAVAHWNLGESLVDTVSGIAFTGVTPKGGMHGPSHWYSIPCYQVCSAGAYLPGTIVARNAALLIPGDVTVEVICMINVPYDASVAATFQPFVAYGGTSAGTAYNIQYAVGCTSLGTKAAYLSESGTGTDRLIAGGVGHCHGTPIYAAATRSGTAVSVYQQGDAQYAATLAELPSGGDDASCGLWIGHCGKSGYAQTEGSFFSVAVTARAKSAAEIAQTYARTLGRFYR